MTEGPRLEITVAELITWTQLGNEAMQEANRRLGYVDRSMARTMRRDIG